MADPFPDLPSVSREQMRLVLEVSRSLAVTANLDALLISIARAGTALLGCERASVFLHDPRHDLLWTKVALQSEPICVPASSGIVGLAFRSNQVINCPDAYANPNFNAEPDRHSGFVTRDLLAAPMVDWDGKPVGVLQAINKISAPFTETDSALLRLLADQAGVAVQRWNLQQQAIQTTNLQHEMLLARRVQEAMIPKHPPVFAGTRCVGWTQPASINGGDCYDLWTCGDRLGILVADAAGHGIAPALVVSQVRTLVRALCETEPDPQKVLWRINDRLEADLEAGQFVTAFLGFLAGDGRLDWCSAGHGSACWFANSSEVKILEATWPPLGYMDHSGSGPTQPLVLQPQDSLVVLSDGITEAFDPRENMFGIDRVIATLRATPPADPAAALRAVREAVIAWQAKDESLDDQTMVIVHRDRV